MAHTNETTNYHLSQFIGTDIPNPLTDYNGDMETIDGAIKSIADTTASDGARVTALETQNGDSVLTTTAQTLSGAINELDSDLGGVDTRLVTAEGKIVADEAVLNDATNNISTLAGKVSGLETKVGSAVLTTVSADLSNAVNELLTDIGAVDTKIGVVKTDLTPIYQTATSGCTVVGGLDKQVYFYLDGELARTTEIIANGGAFVLNSNYEIVTAGALNELSSWQYFDAIDITNTINMVAGSVIAVRHGKSIAIRVFGGNAVQTLATSNAYATIGVLPSYVRPTIDLLKYIVIGTFCIQLRITVDGEVKIGYSYDLTTHDPYDIVTTDEIYINETFLI